jgi:hypothetical protein
MQNCIIDRQNLIWHIVDFLRNFVKNIHLLLKSTHIVLAFILLISSTGLVMNKHYCQNQLKSVALFVAAKPCHQQKAKQACPMHAAMDQDQEESKNCCDDETEYVKADQEQINQSFEVDASAPLIFLASFIQTFLTDHPTTDKASIDFFNYRPPIIVFDQPVVLQTFLC